MILRGHRLLTVTPLRPIQHDPRKFEAPHRSIESVWDTLAMTANCSKVGHNRVRVSHSHSVTGPRHGLTAALWDILIMALSYVRVSHNPANRPAAA
jgi:hypothetical protein